MRRGRSTGDWPRCGRQRGGLTIAGTSWTAFNMASQIVEGATTVNFTYDAFDHRIIQSVSGSSSSTTTYLNALGAHARGGWALRSDRYWRNQRCQASPTRQASLDMSSVA